jgi:hypothetical protein
MKTRIFRWGAPALVALVAIAVPVSAQDRPADHRDHQNQDRHDNHQTSNLEIHVATTAPPAPRHEHRSPRPDADSVWVAGAWDWQGSQWAWTPGRWDRPEVRSAKWVAPRYTRESNAYRYEPGHWSNQKVVEGAEYQQWKQEHGRHSDSKDDRDRRDHKSSN